LTFFDVWVGQYESTIASSGIAEPFVETYGTYYVD